MLASARVLLREISLEDSGRAPALCCHARGGQCLNVVGAAVSHSSLKGAVPFVCNVARLSILARVREPIAPPVRRRTMNGSTQQAISGKAPQVVGSRGWRLKNKARY
jgi:hypothetical protein